MKEHFLILPYIYLIVFSTITGTAARIATIREDYRQYPTYPNGYLNQAVFGFVASTLGAVLVPALVTSNFTAVTFLTLALTQFQNVRKMELNSLQHLEETEYTPRGGAYIDGISKTFEARNYIALLVALTTAAVMELLQHLPLFVRIAAAGLAAGIVFYALFRFSKGRQIGSIADVRPGILSIQNDELFVDGMYVANRIGVERGQRMIMEEGLAVVLYPKSPHYRITLDNYGQRKAILFEITRSLGVKRYHYTRKNYEDGRIVFMVVPILNDIEKMVQAVLHTPILESTKKAHRFLKHPGGPANGS